MTNKKELNIKEKINKKRRIIPRIGNNTKFM